MANDLMKQKRPDTLIVNTVPRAYLYSFAFVFPHVIDHEDISVMVQYGCSKLYIKRDSGYQPFKYGRIWIFSGYSGSRSVG